MDAQLSKVCDELAINLYEFSAYSSAQLVLDILVQWGYKMVKADYFDNPRDVGTAFIMKFDALDHHSIEQSSVVSESEMIWDDHKDSLPAKFLDQFANFPFEDALNAFIMVIDNWLQKSDFAATMRNTGGTKKEVVEEIYKGWFYHIW